MSEVGHKSTTTKLWMKCSIIITTTKALKEVHGERVMKMAAGK
jgi:hypothetical protein